MSAVLNLLPPGGKTKTDVWGTPRALFNELDAEFGFTLDPCSDGTNAMCERFCTPENSGLLADWSFETVFMNPPYSDCYSWMRKAYESSLQGATVVCLVPSRTDTRWWHDYAMKGEVRFLRGRVRFGDAKIGAPFPSVIVVFRPAGSELV
jgi:phage N-6-adenine-methyltransferase